MLIHYYHIAGPKPQPLKIALLKVSLGIFSQCNLKLQPVIRSGRKNNDIDR